VGEWVSGLHALQFIVSDAHTGLAAARRAVFPSIPWQRCQFHLQQNARACVPRLELRSVVAAEIRSIFHGSDLASAQARLNPDFSYRSVARRSEEPCPQPERIGA
jgi:putative transposase